MLQPQTSKRPQLKWRLTVIVLILILQATKLLAQDIQPIGLPKGHYEIKAKGKNQAQVFCVNADITTSAGQIYNSVRLGNQQIYLKIGNKKYSLQSAIDNKLISIKLIDSPEYDDPLNMYVEFINHTNSPMIFEVNDNVVLDKKGSKAPLKSVEFLNIDNGDLFNDNGDLLIEKQNLIWFSQDFDKFLAENRGLLIENNIISEQERPDVISFLKKRQEFLQDNGVMHYNSIVSREGFTFNHEGSLTNLLGYKKHLKEFNSGEFEKQYIVRYYDGKYFVDDGSPMPIYKDDDIYELAKQMSSDQNVYLNFENFPSKTREDNFLTTLKIARRAPIFADFFLYKTPVLKNISEISEEGTKSLFDIDVISKATSEYSKPEHSLTFKEKNRSLISFLREKIYSYFGGINKNANQSLASILEESKTELEKSFTNSELEVLLDHKIIITLNEKNYKLFLNEFYCYEIKSAKAN